MAITSYGYPGSVNSAALALWLPMVSAAQYSVDGPGDWRVSVRGGADRGITIAKGTGAGDGIMDVSTTDFTTLALPAVTGSGSKWFMVVARRTWATKTTTFAVIEGTAERKLPARQNTPGSVSDQPIALCRVQGGQSSVAEIVDLRVWGRNAGMFAFDELVKDYLTRPGTSVAIGPVRHEAYLTAGLELKWRRSTIGGAIGFVRPQAFREPDPNGDGTIATISIPDPGFPYHIAASGTVEAGGGGAGTRWNLSLVINGATVDASRGDVTAPWFQVSGGSWTPANSASTVSLVANRMAGSGPMGVSTFNQFFRAQIFPAI